MARTVLPIVGAVVGFWFGGPQGAQLGFAIGGAVGNAVDPQVIKGPRIGDIPAQTSNEGVPRAIVYGRAAVMGNLIDRGEIQKVINRERQGKGGGPVVESERLYLTFAIRICEGPIAGIYRIWEDEKLVYDVRPGSTILAESAAFAEGFRLYIGGESQLPDPDLEVIHGVGNTPAYRGSAYIVFARKDVTDRRGSVPQYRFEVDGQCGAASSQATSSSEVFEDYTYSWLGHQHLGGTETVNIALPAGSATGDRVYCYNFNTQTGGSIGVIDVVQADNTTPVANLPGVSGSNPLDGASGWTFRGELMKAVTLQAGDITNGYLRIRFNATSTTNSYHVFLAIRLDATFAATITTQSGAVTSAKSITDNTSLDPPSLNNDFTDTAPAIAFAVCRISGGGTFTSYPYAAGQDTFTGPGSTGSGGKNSVVAICYGGLVANGASLNPGAFTATGRPAASGTDQNAITLFIKGA